jgi:hypothetical protein
VTPWGHELREQTALELLGRVADSPRTAERALAALSTLQRHPARASEACDGLDAWAPETQVRVRAQAVNDQTLAAALEAAPPSEADMVRMLRQASGGEAISTVIANGWQPTDDDVTAWIALEHEWDLDHSWPSERTLLHLTKFKSPKRLYKALDRLGSDQARVYSVEKTPMGKRRRGGAWSLLRRRDA